MYNPNTERKAIIDRLKMIYKIKGMKSNELARKAGIASSTISYILKGKCNYKFNMLL